jgi:FHA domain
LHLDIGAGLRDTGRVSQARSLRERLAGILNAAFAEGLLSEQTHSHRLGLLFGPQLVDPHALVGDLALRTPQRTLRTPASAGAAVRRYAAMILRGTRSAIAPLVLALDWTGERDALVIGRDAGCDIELREATVSRRHARLLFRDGAWIIQDLESTNGTTVNGRHVGRCQLHPGDHLLLGLQALEID